MRKYSKYLLASELGISFGSVFLFWLWGLFMVPGTFMDTIRGSENHSRFLIAMFLGLLGLVGLITLIKVVLFEENVHIPLWAIGLLASCGIAALFVGFGSNFNSLLTVFLFVFPIGCTMHFYYLAYRHLTSLDKGRF